MSPALRALLHEVIDYAGLFPPASLDLDPAIRNYARYRGERDAWMLSRFICPAAKLALLERYRDELFSQKPPLRFSVLGRGGESASGFLENLSGDVDAIRAFYTAHGRYVRADAFEARLPGAPLRSRDGRSVSDLLRAAADTLGPIAAGGLACFYEPPPGCDAAALAYFADAIATFNRDYATTPAGFKLRTGGTEPGAIPACELVAAAIAACRDVRIPMKFTAGLHHPVRHGNAELGAKMHGFLNVFVAGVLAHVYNLEGTALTAVLSDEDAKAFQFTDDYLLYRTHAVTPEDVEAARRRFVISFGSCSFDEPREDLTALGLR
ncbi:hypothetical protein RAS1_16290 [Phycisphaerae bacterium RAS1]|nr:hypothetical protein RAS1_16290 [Phycisphaerae bacterium RAS1]